MILVKTRLGLSSIHGLGVFAPEFIPKGTRVWEYCEEFDHRVSKDFVEHLPDPARSTLCHYSAFWGGGYVISADDARFLNHSETPNLKTFADPDIDVALRDINVGEELLEDYREFDESMSERLSPNASEDAGFNAGIDAVVAARNEWNYFPVNMNRIKKLKRPAPPKASEGGK